MEKRVIILDFDGTLYSGEHKFDLILDVVKNNKRAFLPNLSEEEYALVCREVPSWDSAIFGSEITKSITEIIKKFPNLPVSTKDFYNWQDTYTYPIIIDREEIIDLDFLQWLCKEYPVYIVSNSAPSHIVSYMEEIGVNPTWFVEVISNPFNEFDTTKKPCYEYVCQKEGISPQNLYVFGDSRTSDLNPAKIINANTGHVRDARLIPYMVKTALGLNAEKEKEHIISTYHNMLNAPEQTAEHLHKTEIFKEYVMELGIEL